MSRIYGRNRELYGSQHIFDIAYGTSRAFGGQIVSRAAVERPVLSVLETAIEREETSALLAMVQRIEDATTISARIQAEIEQDRTFGASSFVGYAEDWNLLSAAFVPWIGVRSSALLALVQRVNEIVGVTTARNAHDNIFGFLTGDTVSQESVRNLLAAAFALWFNEQRYTKVIYNQNVIYETLYIYDSLFGEIVKYILGARTGVKGMINEVAGSAKHIVSETQAQPAVMQNATAAEADERFSSKTIAGKVSDEEYALSRAKAGVIADELKLMIRAILTTSLDSSTFAQKSRTSAVSDKATAAIETDSASIRETLAQGQAIVFVSALRQVLSTGLGTR